MPFPHVEDLLKRPRIEKPSEEFLLPPPAFAPSPASPGTRPLPTGTASSSASVQSLVDEAAQLQALIDALTQSAREVVVTVPPVEAALVGATVGTRQYLAALAADPADPAAGRTRRAYEVGLLAGAPDEWPVLLLGDLSDQRDALLATAGVLTGTALARTAITSGSPDWTRDAQDSHLAAVQAALLQSSRRLRAQVLHAIATGRASMGGGFWNSVLDPVRQAFSAEVRPRLEELDALLARVLALFRFYQHTRAVEFDHLQGALESEWGRHLVRSLLQGLTVLLSRATTRLAAPVLAWLEEGAAGGTPLAQVEDAATRRVASVLVDAVQALSRHTTQIAADLIRQENRKAALSQAKTQALGEHATVGRWIREIEAARQEIRQELAQTAVTPPALARLAARVARPLPPAHPELDRAVSFLPGAFTAIDPNALLLRGPAP